MKSILALLSLSVLSYAEVVMPGGGVIAHIADGGGITMNITVVNLDDTANTWQLIMYADSGALLPIATDVGTLNTFGGTLAPHGSFTIHTLGAGATATQGWAWLITSGTIGGSVVFKVNAAPWSGSETMLPLDTWKNNRFSLVFDHTGTNTTGLAMANPSSTTAIAVTVTFKDQSGAVIVTKSFSMPPFTHTTSVATNDFPLTNGKTGTVEISTTGASMGVLGLRFGPTAVSSILPLVSNSWVPATNPNPNPMPNPYPY
ncbi:MAG TPA: hypothetical protein VGR73_11660 [Bryobacteraceae bacterium]|nr:hypothetical protein [Bryobacteraceae bacterium]